MKFCLLENKKVAWYQRLCTIETTILKRRKNVYCIIICVPWYHVQFESNFVASLVSLFQALSPVLHLHWWDLTVMQIITPCIATKLKVCYLLQMLFFVTFNSLLAKNVLVILINCYFTSACTWHFLFYGRTFLQSNWENCEHQKYFWNVIVLQDKSQLGMRN